MKTCMLVVVLTCCAIALVKGQAPAGSCVGDCFTPNAGDDCSCTTACVVDDDCCADFFDECVTNCSEILVVPTLGSIDVTSPLYPELYPNNALCQWLVSSESGADIMVEFQNFNTEEGYDFYSAGNGDSPGQSTSVIWLHSGTVAPDDFRSTGPDVWMRFRSDQAVNAPGFHVTLSDSDDYCGGQCGVIRPGCSCDIDCMYNDNCCVDYFESCAADCTYEYALSPGESIDIMSNNYPADYNNGDQCKWVVTGGESTELRVEYIDFETEDGKDYYFAGHGTETTQASSEVWAHSGSVAPADFYTKTNAVWMTFLADSANTARGFHIVVTQLGGSCAETCGSVLSDCRCLTDCVYTDNCCRNFFDYCAANCSERLVISDLGKTDVTSPDYPDNYPNNAVCQWITKTVNGNDILVQFQDFVVEGGYDYFYAGNGDTPSQNTSVIWEYSGNVAPSDFRSLGDTVWIRFISDATVTRRGFHTALSDGGTVPSP